MANFHSEFLGSAVVDSFFDSYMSCDLEDSVFAEQDFLNLTKAHDAFSLSIESSYYLESIYEGLKFRDFSPVTNQKYN
ncbi:MAG: hypothetical protein WCQ44_09355 [Opitutaceae bacterium]